MVIYLVDSSRLMPSGIAKLKTEIQKFKNKHPQKPVIVILNKIDTLKPEALKKIKQQLATALLVSAKTGKGIEDLKKQLLEFVNTGALRNNETIVTNTRHYNSLLKALEAIEKVQLGIREEIASDLMAIDIREGLYHLGEITGQVTNDELLGNIFANFCIGK